MKNNNSYFYQLQAMAERIQKGRVVDGELEAFSNLSEELKQMLFNDTDNEEVIERLNRLPKIAYQEFSPSLMAHLRLNGLTQLWRQKDRRREILSKVRSIASTYASIYHLINKEQRAQS